LFFISRYNNNNGTLSRTIHVMQMKWQFLSESPVFDDAAKVMIELTAKNWNKPFTKISKTSGGY